MARLRSDIAQGGIVTLLGAACWLGACTDGEVSFAPGAGAPSGGSSAQAGSATGGATGGSSGSGSAGSAQGDGGSEDGGASSEGGAGGDAAGGAGTAGSSGGRAGSGGQGGSAAGAGGTIGSGGTSGGGRAGDGGQAGDGGLGGDGGQAGDGGGGEPGCIPEPEVCDGLDNDCDDIPDEGQTCPVGCTGATYGAHRYLFCSTTDTADDAAERCAKQDMSLLEIQDQAENAFIAGKLKGTSWLGASDEQEDQHWYWYPSKVAFWDAGPLPGVYSNWSAGYPAKGPQGKQRTCAVISASQATLGEWMDVSCSAIGYRVACEAPQ